MANLRTRMARFGFESNDDYDYRLRCLLNYRTKGLRCLSVEGDSKRRKTAFANALGQALDWPHLLYHDFTQVEDPPGKARVPDLDDEEGEPPTPLTAFDRVVSEACAFSEAEFTILILDQLQAADFREHLRLYRFVSSCEWVYPLATLRANPKHFLLMLISEEPLFHSLQKESFRIWTETEKLRLDYQPVEFGYEPDFAPVMAALANVFHTIGIAPTRSEYQRLLDDLVRHARTENHLRHSIYGWTEGLDHAALEAEEVAEKLAATIAALTDYLGCDEIHVEPLEEPSSR